jgi:hypothetical protein
MRSLQFGARQTGQAKCEAGLSTEGSAWWGYYLFLYLCRALTLCVLAAIPTKGENIEDIANDFQNLIMPGVMHWQHPSFFAYFPAAGTLESIIGDLYATTVMNPGFNVCVPSCRLFTRLTLLGCSGCVAPHAPSSRTSPWIGRLSSTG